MPQFNVDHIYRWQRLAFLIVAGMIAILAMTWLTREPNGVISDTEIEDSWNRVKEFYKSLKMYSDETTYIVEIPSGPQSDVFHWYAYRAETDIRIFPTIKDNGNPLPESSVVVTLPIQFFRGKGELSAPSNLIFDQETTVFIFETIWTDPENGSQTTVRKISCIPPGIIVHDVTLVMRNQMAKKLFETRHEKIKFSK